MKHYKFTIPTKPYLAQYLQALYGRPLVFTTTNYFGTTLLGYMSMRMPMKLKELEHRHVDLFNHPLDVYMPRYFLLNKKFMTDMPAENIIHLNKHFENRFVEDLARYTLTMQLMDVPIQDATDDFCRRHGIEIEEHIGMDAIFKKEQRARMAMVKRGLIPTQPMRPYAVQGLLY